MKLLILTVLVLSSFTFINYGSIFYYKGSIGNNDKIQMSLEVSDANSAKGSYIAERSGEVFELEGQMNVAEKVFLFDVRKEDSDKVIANIKARYFVDDHDEMLGMKGHWKSADGLITKTITLEKVAEFIASNEKDSKDNCSSSW